MGQSTSEAGRLRRRIERYGSCMANIRWHITEILFLRRRELHSLLQSIAEDGPEAETTMRVVHVIRYAYLNVRFVLEQIAFGMALAHYDALRDRKLLDWKPKTIITALKRVPVSDFYPTPVQSSAEHLSLQEFLTSYGLVNRVLHTGNPLNMEKRESIDRLTTAPANDATKVLKQARQMTATLNGIRNLLVEHRVTNSFEGCDAWLVRMCDEEGQIRLSTRSQSHSIECDSPFQWRDREGIEFWRHGRVP